MAALLLEDLPHLVERPRLIVHQIKLLLNSDSAPHPHGQHLRQCRPGLLVILLAGGLILLLAVLGGLLLAGAAAARPQPGTAAQPRPEAPAVAEAERPDRPNDGRRQQRPHQPA